MASQVVNEVIRQASILHAPPGDTVRAASLAMTQNRCGSILVIEDGCLLGIFTERDALNRVLACGRDPDRTRLDEVMTVAPDTIDADAPVSEAIRQMDQFGYSHLPVLDRGRLRGVISIRDLSRNDGVDAQLHLEEWYALAERIW
jgi:CBS domain-containing protein